MTFRTNPLKGRSNQLPQLQKEIKAEVATLNWAETWILCSCASAAQLPRGSTGCPARSSLKAQWVLRTTAGGQAGPGAPASIPGRRHSQDMHLGNILRSHQNIANQTQSVIHSRAGQKNTAAKLSAPGFWIELLKAWHTDQSWMASPTQDSSTARFFYKTKI